MSTPHGRQWWADQWAAVAVRPQFPSPSWRHPDSRHFGALVIGAVAGAGGPIVAGAPFPVILAFAVGGLLLLGVPCYLVLQPWRDPKHGSWVGGAMFLTLAVTGLAVALLIGYG